MLSTILCSLLPPVALPPAVPAPVPLVQDEAGPSEVETKIAEAGEDVEKLVALAAAFKEADDNASSRKVFERVLEIDPNHEAAHKALRHHFYDGQWFTSYAALSKYRRAETKRMKEEFGLVRFNDEWVPEADVPYLRMGWVKQEDGTWISQKVLDRQKKEAEYLANNWQQRTEDSTWINPENFDLWRDGLYKAPDDEWMTKEEANAYHSEIGQWWEYIGEHFVVRSTCDVDTTNWIKWYADKTYDDLVRIYGKEPTEKPIFGCFHSLAQYNNFAAGDQTAGRQATETGGFSSLHYAYLADIWFDIDPVAQSADYIGGGVAYFDVSDEKLAKWGPYAVRHAAALSYAENIDRSWNAVSQFLTNAGGGGGSPTAIFDEKRIPRWMLYGAASYVERYFQDKDAAAQDGDPWAIRNWAIAQATAQPIHSLTDLFAFPLDINDLDGSARLVHESGLMVSFIMDGGCKPVEKAHEAFKTALKGDGDIKPAVEALQQAVLDNEIEFRKFAGLPEEPEPEPEPEATEEEPAETASVDTGQGG